MISFDFKCQLPKKIIGEKGIKMMSIMEIWALGIMWGFPPFLQSFVTAQNVIEMSCNGNIEQEKSGQGNIRNIHWGICIVWFGEEIEISVETKKMQFNGSMVQREKRCNCTHIASASSGGLTLKNAKYFLILLSFAPIIWIINRKKIRYDWKELGQNFQTFSEEIVANLSQGGK